MDFSQLSPQAAQSTRHQQSPEYLRGLTLVKREFISKGGQFMKLTKNVKYTEKIKSQLDMGLVTMCPSINNTCKGNRLNSFLKIFAESADNSEYVAQDEMPHVLLCQKLITYISDNGSNFAQVTHFSILQQCTKRKPCSQIVLITHLNSNLSLECLKWD